MEPISPIVLAAGASRRMGSPKAQVELASRTALRWVLDACARADLATPIVVAGAHVDAVRAAARGASREPTIVENASWERGRATSIRAGLAALPHDALAFLIWPVDAPLAGEGATVDLLVDAWRRRSPEARGWVPSHDGRRGHPVLLARSVARELERLEDDAPARDVIRALAAAGELEHVLVRSPFVLADMNTPEDARRLEAALARGRHA
jgi:CTP:molybdopterin cytidylyltransferase MocA